MKLCETLIFPPIAPYPTSLCNLVKNLKIFRRLAQLTKCHRRLHQCQRKKKERNQNIFVSGWKNMKFRQKSLPCLITPKLKILRSDIPRNHLHIIACNFVATSCLEVACNLLTLKKSYRLFLGYFDQFSRYSLLDILISRFYRWHLIYPK